MSITLNLPPCGLGLAFIKQNQPHLFHMTDFQISEGSHDVPISLVEAPSPHHSSV